MIDPRINLIPHDDWRYWRIKQLRSQIRACEKIMRDDVTSSLEQLEFTANFWQQQMEVLQELQLATFDRS